MPWSDPEAAGTELLADWDGATGGCDCVTGSACELAAGVVVPDLADPLEQPVTTIIASSTKLRCRRRGVRELTFTPHFQSPSRKGLVHKDTIGHQLGLTKPLCLRSS